MASCDITSCFSLDCGRENVGGIEEIYVQTKSALTGVTTTSGQITAIAMAGSKKFYTYELIAETGTASELSPMDKKNATVFYDQTISFRLPKIETAKRNELALVSQSPLTVIVKNNLGKYFLFGETHGIDMTKRDALFGTEFGDYSGYEIEFTGRQAVGFKEIDAAIVPALLAACV